MQWDTKPSKEANHTSMKRLYYEHNLSSQACQGIPKVSGCNINSKSKTGPGIGDLFTDPNNPKSMKTDKDNEKANNLADFFTSVFALEPDADVPTLDSRLINTCMGSLSVSVGVVTDVLLNLTVTGHRQITSTIYKRNWQTS
jgi:hypothetical protein